MPELQYWKQHGPSFSPFKLVLITRPEIEMKNFTNPGLAQLGFEKPGQIFCQLLQSSWSVRAALL